MSTLLRFDRFEVDLAAGRLLSHGARIHLREQSFQVLALLLEHPGEIVRREDLRRRLWPGEVYVDFENNLNTAVARLREALGDSADHPHFVETLPRRGYRFIAAVSQPAPAATAQKPRLLVLPLVNSSDDPGQEYFADAMTDEIISAVAAIAADQLAVIARTTSMRYKRTHKDVARIGRELRLDYVVEGGVRRAGDWLSVNVQLVQAATETHLFARSYGVPMPDLFSLQDRIAQDITRHVPGIADAMRRDVALGPDVGRRRTDDLAAYNEYIKGRYEMWKLTADGMAQAQRHFEAALARDPDYVPACNALGELYWYGGFFGYAPSREMDLIARSYVVRAVSIDSRSAEAHALLSLYPTKRGSSEEIDYYDWPAIRKEVERARDLDAASRLVQIRHAMVQGTLGHMDEAAAELEAALEFDPLSLDLRAWLVSMLYLGRHVERALAEALNLLDLEPGHFLPHYQLGHVYREMGRFDESADAFRRAVELSGELPLMVGFLGLSLGLGGHVTEAGTVLEQLHALAGRRYVPPTCFAWTYLGVGDIDQAFSWMDRAIDAPDRMMEAIKTYAFLDPLRSDPRFAALLRKMNLEAERVDPGP